MTMDNSALGYDLLILTDATASMHSYLEALNASLPRIIAISALTNSFARIGVLAYRDYCGGRLTEWSGWHGKGGETSREDLIRFTKGLRADYGGDWPEATKTGFAKAHSAMRSSAKTLILLYTDAPPHMPWNTQPNRKKEQEFLRDGGGYSKNSHLFADWVSAVRTIASGKKQAQVFAIVQSHLVDTLSPYLFMCHQTKGCCFEIDAPDSDLISSLTMSLILTWLGVTKPGAASTTKLARLLEYKDTSRLTRIKNENDPEAQLYFLQEDKKPLEKIVHDNIIRRQVDESDLKTAITQRDPLVQDFSKRYKEDEEYRVIVVEHLRQIIAEDVLSVAVNPVFGNLWRAVCNDRTNDARDSLIAQFGASIERITGLDQRAKMKIWLDESYNYEAEITELIESVPQGDRYPCVFLDPTLDWSTAPMEGDPGKGGASFTRGELLEIGRSCDHRILRRLGCVLTRLTYVESEDDIPAHIRDLTDNEVPRIPLALAEPKYKQQFWKLLLHLIVPGTKLASRPAALLAALSIRMGMKPLIATADIEMINWSKQWNKLDVPETWNTNCLSLILDADKSFEARREAGEVASNVTENASLLGVNDRRLFERLVEYSLLKANMETSLQARIGWCPNKTKIPIGPLVICRMCKFPRSVTMMAKRGVCGICACPEKEYCRGRTKKQAIQTNVSQDDREATKATWVECSVSTCRAQYVVYDAASLNVRPKCYYCREQGKAASGHGREPVSWVECTKCLNRMIWPKEYRPAAFSVTDFKCPACDSGHATIIDVETTPKMLSSENGTSWLLCNTNNKIPDALAERSLFKTIAAAGTNNFADMVEILPRSETASLTIRGKVVRNTPDIKEELRRWIDSRRAEQGICSLCFSNFKKRDLHMACRRRGCAQQICIGCRQGWYGLNRRGRIINVAALSCPFCRRTPAANAISGVSGGLNYLVNLRNAVEEAGSWIYGWCDGCGTAKRFMERVCAQGPPPALEGWNCDECRENSSVASKPKDVKIIKYCPGCRTPTEKISGCDHIHCTICKNHWCFFCGEAVVENEIYNHMSRVHGGYYGGNEAADYDTSDTEDGID
ncbi:hypothetical protein F5B20DRAFT_564225 [Whalleya microplaca]|nr:hypothetical protein F5B20DRAFT_564225 [Whalleya microplaca]